MIAPLIKPIRLQGGSFYTFSSASEDLGLTFNDSAKKFKFSKFALLNLPNLQTPQQGENFIGLSNVPGAYTEIDGSKNLNDYFGESFQNYCLNLEALITSDATYDANVNRTVSERVFFKWLKEIGAIRFRAATPESLRGTAAGPRWTEEADSLSYTKVVKYIGDINILNSVRNNFNAFSEIYIYIPTSHGNTPTILFNSIQDTNYAPSKAFTNTPNNALAAEYLYGRDANTVQPAGLSTFAFYDSDTFTFTVSDPFGALGEYYSYKTPQGFLAQGVSGFQWWFSNPAANTYFLEPTTFTSDTTDTFKIQSINKTVEYKRSRLDGITLEFDPTRYTGIDNSTINGNAVTDFGTFNETATAQTFDFNAVLIYYDLYDPEDPENPTSTTTNLFGVLFLDNVDSISSGGGYIPRLTKYKPNSLTGDNGNSYAFKINLKFDVNTQDTAVETNINDYNPQSLSLYMDALNQMIEAVTLLQGNQQVINDLQIKFSELQEFILTNQNAEEINLRLTTLEQSIKDNGTIYANSANLLNLIERNYTEITNIYQNKTTVDMVYNLDLITSGQGIFLDKTDSNKVQIVNNNQMFNLNTSPLISLVGNFAANPSNYSYTTVLDPFTNYLKITDGTTDTPFDVDRDVIIYVNDSVKSWQKGQVLRITFSNGLDLNNTNGQFNFIIYTDATDRLKTGFPYSAQVGFVSYLEFENKNGRPIIELICLDPETYSFTVDIF